MRRRERERERERERRGGGGGWWRTDSQKELEKHRRNYHKVNSTYIFPHHVHKIHHLSQYVGPDMYHKADDCLRWTKIETFAN